jgi:hypothetical protein
LMAAFRDGPARLVFPRVAGRRAGVVQGEVGVMPWDGVDRRRDEDAREKRKRSRRRFRLGGRRAIDGSEKRERRDLDRSEAGASRS